jgi:hypothetical protein
MLSNGFRLLSAVAILLGNMTPQKIASIVAVFAVGVLIGFVGYRLLLPTSSTPVEQPRIVIEPEPTEQPTKPTEPKRVAINWTGCEPKSIDIIEPELGGEVSFPFILKVIVDNSKYPNCRWTVFEAQAGSVVVKGQDGTVVGRGILQTEEDWMTNGPVSFEAKVEALPTMNPGGRLTVEITEDDPSGEKVPQTVSFPVVVASPSARCGLQPETGTCKAAIPKYAFDDKTGTCKTFIWGGCGGVVPFEDLESCEATCVNP